MCQIIKSTIVITIIFTVGVFPAFSQGAPPATPIDGGLSVLLIAGGIYGARKLKIGNNEQKKY